MEENCFNEYEYEDLDCATLPMFSGGFVNFGYWKNIDYKNLKISPKTREKSSIDLYAKSIKFLNIDSSDTILEVGCGSGTGIPVIWQNYQPKKIIGLDVSNSQIIRASRNNSDLLKQNILFLVTEPAEKTKLPTASINKIISIESLQNFYSIDSFIKESKRILSKDGMIVISTIFAKGEEHSKEINKLKPDGIKRKDHIFPIEKIINTSQDHFDIKIVSIGDYVFEGYHTYISQLGLTTSGLWSSNFYESFKKGWIDYYILVLTKCR